MSDFNRLTHTHVHTHMNVRTCTQTKCPKAGDLLYDVLFAELMVFLVHVELD